jgi:integral membrane sensor domain MASE1
MSSSTHRLPDGPDVAWRASERVTWPWLIALAAGLLLLARLGAHAMVLGHHVGAFNPASGIAAGALAIATRRRWLLIGVVFGITLVVQPIPLHSASAHVASAAGTATEAAVFAWLLATVWPRARDLDTRVAVLQFFGAAVVAAGVGTAITTLGITLTPTGSIPATSWAVGTESHTLGILTMAPIVLLGGRLRRLDARGSLELAGFVALLLVATRVGFNPNLPAMCPYVPLGVLLFSVVWVGTPGAALLPMVLVPVAVLETIGGRGPFALTGPEYERVLATQLYGLFAAAGAWLVAAVLAERAAAVDELRSANSALDTRVAERTAALAREIEHAQLAAQISEALGEAKLDEHATMQSIGRRLADSLGDACVVLHLVDDGTAPRSRMSARRPRPASRNPSAPWSVDRTRRPASRRRHAGT